MNAHIVHMAKRLCLGMGRMWDANDYCFDRDLQSATSVGALILHILKWGRERRLAS